MKTRHIQISFILIFCTILLVPLFSTNLKDGAISSAEKRTLAPKPSIKNEDGTINQAYTSDFELWINDNIGLRSPIIETNAKLQYYIFKVLSNNSNMYLGPNGEFNYANEAMLADYQHTNLYTEDYLQAYASSFQALKNNLTKQGIDVYYVQCWDKHSIYPEYFPTSVIQKGNISKTDQMVDALNKLTDITIISPKQILIDAKQDYPTYSVYGDSTHWTQRGAYIAYKQIMSTINEHSNIQYDILNDNDYNITITDQGDTLFGGIHEEDYLEDFTIKSPQAILANDRLTVGADDERHSYRVNPTVSNDTRLLIIGDSYFNEFLVDDFAESFSETIMIWGDHLGQTIELIDAYKPDIVIFEAAERVDRSQAIIDTVDKLK